MTALGSPGATDRAPAVGAARLLAFVGLAAFAAAHWVSLVEDPPAGRALLAVLAIAGGGVGLLAIGRARLPRLAAAALAVVTVVAATALSLAAVGVSIGLLWPAGWDQLGINIDRGLSGLAGDVDYPYRGANEWSRLAILAAAPLALGLAAALAFWPARDGTGSRLRLAGLLALVALYATAVAINAPSSPLLRGLLLLALVAAWLWLPRLRPRDLLVAAGLVAAAGAIALPAASRLDGSDPWISYQDWTWASDTGVGYRWNHSYGPLDWPRDGSTMFAVQSNEPHYWRTAVLDQFDGHRWERSEASRTGTVELPQTVQRDEPAAIGSSEWLQRVRITIGGLRSDFVVAPGTPLAVDGLEGARSSPDGTTVVDGKSLSEGDSYSVTAYVPDPDEEELRAAEGPYAATLAPYTQVAVPGTPTVENAGPSALRPTASVQVPFRGQGDLSPDAGALLASSPYAQTYELASQLVANEPTTFDAVKAIEDRLRQSYGYSENPPSSDYPLASFLFEDRVGYCQHFSGAMTLMLRLVGIPARVASGFAPGSPDLDEDGVFQVEDFDAHSWVEVYFSGIGWVPFDPTPAASPAASQIGTAAAEVASGNLRREFAPVEGGTNAENVRNRQGRGDSSGGSGLLIFGAIVLGTALLAAAVIGWRAAQFRRLEPAVAAEAQVRELGSGLGRMGWPVREGETLRRLERRLRRAGKPKSAGYLAGLRDGRYGNGASTPPTLASRRGLRRELTHARGLRGRLRGLLALPPGGPRSSPR